MHNKLDLKLQLFKVFMSQINSHGGRRPGAGRKKGSAKAEPSVVMRIPQSQQLIVRDLINAHKANLPIPSRFLALTISRPAATLKNINLPLFSSKVAAGFPSPADEHVEKRLDPNDFLIDNEEATFFVTIKGQSMIDAGLLPGDKVVVDRSKNARKNNIVLAVVDGEFTIKRLGKSPDGRP
ncbi:MAG: S24 family peptidase, partial [Methylophaga sp.]